MKNYLGFSLDQIMDDCVNYEVMCNLFFELVHDAKTREKLEAILYNGKYKDFCFYSDLGRSNPFLEAQRRISMAYLLIRNPETFDVLVESQVNLFHGTNSNALSSILKYGLNSGAYSEKMGINVSTGEKWSRGGKQRNFVSFTDVLGVADYYSAINDRAENDGLSFEVVIGTTARDVCRAGRCAVGSDLPEVGVRDRLPLESIRVICVPSDKVDYVRRLVGNDSIKVVARDDTKNKFYKFDDYFGVDISFNGFENFKSSLRTPSKGIIFKLEEIKNMMVHWLASKVSKIKEGKVNGYGGEKEDYEGRAR